MEITLIHRPSSSEVLAVKNPRVARACRQCRQRKIRCDGVSPVCFLYIYQCYCLAYCQINSNGVERF
ncbi:hypothetical protein V1524DRAFT_441876 [Lipomyces starkeyi]